MRADIPGLKAGSYSLKVVAIKGGGETLFSEVTALQVKNYSREGFAHKGFSGIGAYNDDGSLKSNAVVIYVNKDNAKTVTAHLGNGSFTGLQSILNAYQKGNITTPLVVRVLGLIKNGDTDTFGSSSEGIQIKGKKADSEMNITIEGIGEDATIYGFGFLVRNAKYGIGATMGSSVFSENNYFRATKEPILISRQGNDANGAGKFSGEAGGMIKEYGSIFAEKGTAESYSPITYAANNKSFDFFQATSRDEKVPSSVVSLNGGNTYNNFDTTSSLMYSYTPDATSMVPERVTGYYGAGRLNHGSLKFKFDNAVEDNNSAPIPALEALIDNYTGK